MATTNPASHRRLAAWAAILLSVILFVSVNLLAQGLFSSTRLDVTQDRLYTLAPGTKEVLRGIDEPIRLRLYQSDRLSEFGPVYSAHAKRVGDLLQSYSRLSGGKLVVERYDPDPFSPEEDLAVADGLRGIPVSIDGSQIYFGLAAVNSTDDLETISYLAPERAEFLEYDLTKLVYDLANPNKPKVALIGDLPLQGNQFTQFQRWRVIESMEEFFDVTVLAGSIDRIEADVGIVMLAQPASVDEKTLYAIDQFVMRGGKVLAFVDPHAEAMAAGAPNPGADTGSVTAVTPLLASWGVTIDPEMVVGDRLNAARVQTMDGGRQVITDYLPWLGVSQQGFSAEDVVTGNLAQLNLRSAGAIRPNDNPTTELEPIVRSSAESMLIDRARLRQAPDAVGLLRAFQPAGEAFALAARISGPVKSAFPDGPPEAVTDETIRGEHRLETENAASIILVADADLLADQNWVQRRSLLGQEFLMPIANNGDFVINALDQLRASTSLVGLRGRGLTSRPFVVLQEMGQKAEAQFRASEQALLTKIEETQAKIRQLQDEEQEGGLILSATQQQTIDDFRQEMIELRQELRQVQFNLNKDVEALETRIKVLNIWVIPIAVGIFAVGLALYRRRRAARFAQSIVG